jgi:putative membrane protein
MSEPHAHMQLWSFLVAALVAAAEFVYLRGWLCLRDAFPSLVARWRLAAFTTGLVLVWILIGSPLAALDHRSLTIHMMKHLLLMTVAAPLVLEGAPAFPLVCALPKLFIKSYPPLPARWLDRCIMHPALCWLAGTMTVIAWHIPAVFQMAQRSNCLHSFEDISFIVAGVLFWSPVVGRFSSGMKPLVWYVPLYLFLATLPCDILSAFLAFYGRVVYPNYHVAVVMFSLSPLQDQQCAGALMWVWVTYAYLIPAVIITVQILSFSNLQPLNPIPASSPSIVRADTPAAELRSRAHFWRKDQIPDIS